VQSQLAALRIVDNEEVLIRKCHLPTANPRVPKP
jgi:hypothetical protein